MHNREERGNKEREQESLLSAEFTEGWPEVKSGQEAAQQPNEKQHHVELTCRFLREHLGLLNKSLVFFRHFHVEMFKNVSFEFGI